MAGSFEVSLDLQRLANQNVKIRDKVLTKAAVIIADELEKVTPKFDKDFNPVHAKESIAVSKVDKNGEISIGWTKASKVASRIHLVEFGTINQPPQNFIGGTVNSLQRDLMKFIEKELKKGFGL